MRTIPYLKIRKQGASPGSLFFRTVSRKDIAGRMRATAIPTGASLPHTASLSAGNCHGAEPTFNPALHPAAEKLTHHFVNNNKKTACVSGRNSVKYAYETAEAYKAGRGGPQSPHAPMQESIPPTQQETCAQPILSNLHSFSKHEMGVCLAFGGVGTAKPCAAFVVSRKSLRGPGSPTPKARPLRHNLNKKGRTL